MLTGNASWLSCNENYQAHNLAKTGRIYTNINLYIKHNPHYHTHTHTSCISSWVKPNWTEQTYVHSVIQCLAGYRLSSRDCLLPSSSLWFTQSNWPYFYRLPLPMSVYMNVRFSSHKYIADDPWLCVGVGSCIPSRDLTLQLSIDRSIHLDVPPREGHRRI